MDLQGDGTISPGNRSRKISFHLSSSLWLEYGLALDLSKAACLGVTPSGGCPAETSQIEGAGTVAWESRRSSVSKTRQHLLQYGAVLWFLYRCSLFAINSAQDGVSEKLGNLLHTSDCIPVRECTNAMAVDVVFLRIMLPKWTGKSALTS